MLKSEIKVKKVAAGGPLIFIVAPKFFITIKVVQMTTFETPLKTIFE